MKFALRQYARSLITVMALALVAQHALASHHFESAVARKTVQINQLDNYVFQSSRPGYTVFVMSVNSAPKAEPGGAFLPTALYNIHVSNDDAFKTGHTFSMSVDMSDQYTLYESDAPNGPVGALGQKVGEGILGKSIDTKNGIKMWAGIAKDPFYGNSPGLGLFRMKLNSGVYDPSVWTSVKGTNIFSGRTSSIIVLDVPNSMLGKDIKVFMTTAVKQGDAWEQVQYSANPLFSHSMLFESEALKEQHDHSRPDNDMEMKHFVAARVARASHAAKSQADPFAYGDMVADMLVPDVLSYKVGTKAEYSNAMRNGRSIDDDAMGAMLTLLIGTPTDQAIANPKLYTAAFPYIIPAVAK